MPKTNWICDCGLIVGHMQSCPKCIKFQNKRIGKFEYLGEFRKLKDWGEIHRINPMTLYKRIRRGWTFEKAVTTPVTKKEWKKD